MSSESLQSILSHAETLNMSEGDYLIVANALKSAFQQSDNKHNIITYKTDNINDICLVFDNGINDMSVKNYVKSISAIGLKEPMPTNYKIQLQSEISYKNNPEKNKTIEYTIETYGRKMGKLYTLSELIEPKSVSIKINDLECEYTCYSYLKEMKYRFNEEIKLNNPDDDDDDFCLDIDNFKSMMISKFIDTCKHWFHTKYEETP